MPCPETDTRPPPQHPRPRRRHGQADHLGPTSSRVIPLPPSSLPSARARAPLSPVVVPAESDVCIRCLLARLSPLSFVVLNSLTRSLACGGGHVQRATRVWHVASPVRRAAPPRPTRRRAHAPSPPSSSRSPASERTQAVRAVPPAGQRRTASGATRRRAAPASGSSRRAAAARP